MSNTFYVKRNFKKIKYSYNNINKNYKIRKKNR